MGFSFDLWRNPVRSHCAFVPADVQRLSVASNDVLQNVCTHSFISTHGVNGHESEQNRRIHSSLLFILSWGTFVGTISTEGAGEQVH